MNFSGLSPDEIRDLLAAYTGADDLELISEDMET
jgi:hypothetical protein